MVPTQPKHRALSRLVVEEPAYQQQPALALSQMPSRRSFVVVWLMHHLPRRPLVAVADLASHPCLLGDLMGPVDLVGVGFGSSREGQWAC